MSHHHHIIIITPLCSSCSSDATCIERAVFPYPSIPLRTVILVIRTFTLQCTLTISAHHQCQKSSRFQHIQIFLPIFVIKRTTVFGVIKGQLLQVQWLVFGWWGGKRETVYRHGGLCV